MSKYKVKLIEGHKAKANQNVNGYLGSLVEGIPSHYTRGVAIKKAAAFGGKIEVVKSSLTFETMRMAKISRNALIWGIETELVRISPEFVDTNIALNEKIYTADVFSNMFDKDRFDPKALIQLEELINEMQDFDYVMLID